MTDSEGVPSVVEIMHELIEAQVKSEQYEEAVKNCDKCRKDCQSSLQIVRYWLSSAVVSHLLLARLSQLRHLLAGTTDFEGIVTESRNSTNLFRVKVAVSMQAVCLK